MRPFLALAGLALLAVAPAYAQADKKAPRSPTTCLELIIFLDAIVANAETKIEDTDTGCRVTNFYVGTDSYTRFRIEELVLEAPTLFENFAEDLPPTELDLTITGFTNAPDTGSLLNNYIIEVQSEPMDIHFAYRWDRDASTVEVSDLSVSAKDYGVMRLSGRLSDMDFNPERLDVSEAIPGAFDHLIVELDNAAFFSAMVAPMLLGYLPYDEDPRPLIADYKQSAIAAFDGLSEDTLSPDSKAALTTFINAFPKPTGDYTFDLRADPPLEVNVVSTNPASALATILSRLQLAVTHQPAE